MTWLNWDLPVWCVVVLVFAAYGFLIVSANLRLWYYRWKWRSHRGK